MRWLGWVTLGTGASALGAATLVAAWSVAVAHASITDGPTERPSTRCQDRDLDGYGLGCALGRDCNDRDPTVHPGRTETCNFRDDDCNALVDDLAGCEPPPLDASHVTVAAGRFRMGSNAGAKDESPVHTVLVAAFEMDRHEVTNRRYRECVRAGACSEPKLLSSHHRRHYYEQSRFADYPVIFVDWHQASAFCRYAGGRLPTEAEWEKAARGAEPSTRTYPWGEATPECSRANMGGPQSCVGDTDRVGRRHAGASPYGALDLAGNVWEWVSDWYSPTYYAASPPTDPTGPGQGHLKVMRGGCWVSGADTLRASCRKAELPSSWAYNVGFRCVYPEGR